MASSDRLSEAQVKHLEFIQAAVGRMATNSFQLKALAVLLVSALLGLAVNADRTALAALATLPAVSFWGLDAYYLRQERLFRKLYDGVRLGEEDAHPGLYSLETKGCQKDVPTWACTFLASTIWPVHGVLTAVVAGAGVYVGVFD